MSTLETLRTTLFETLQDVKSGKMEIDRARSICAISQTIINTAKVEIDFAEATGKNVQSSLINSDSHGSPVTIPNRQSVAEQLTVVSGKGQAR